MRLLSTRVHGYMDYAMGLLLIAAPWLLGFADYVWAPHLIFGLLEIGAALTTSRTPSHATTGTMRR